MISFVSIAVAVTTVLHQPSITINKPSSLNNGDLLIAFVGVSQGVPQAAPQGWNFLSLSKGTTGSNVWATVYTRWVTGNEPASWTWALDPSNAGAVGTIIAYRGVSPYFSQIDYALSTGAQTNKLNTNFPVTLVNFFFIDWSPITWYGGENQGTIFRANFFSNDNALAVGEYTQTIAGPVDNLVCNASQGQGITSTLVLLPK